MRRRTSPWWSTRRSSAVTFTGKISCTAKGEVSFSPALTNTSAAPTITFTLTDTKCKGLNGTSLTQGVAKLIKGGAHLHAAYGQAPGTYNCSAVFADLATPPAIAYSNTWTGKRAGIVPTGVSFPQGTIMSASRGIALDLSGGSITSGSVRQRGCRRCLPPTRSQQHHGQQPHVGLLGGGDEQLLADGSRQGESDSRQLRRRPARAMIGPKTPALDVANPRRSATMSLWPDEVRTTQAVVTDHETERPLPSEPVHTARRDPRRAWLGALALTIVGTLLAACSGSPTATVGGGPKLSGLGATQTEWNTHHERGSGHPASDSYGPSSRSLQGGSDRSVHRGHRRGRTGSRGGRWRSRTPAPRSPEPNNRCVQLPADARQTASDGPPFPTVPIRARSSRSRAGSS